jgi:hypothetical protein
MKHYHTSPCCVSRTTLIEVMPNTNLHTSHSPHHNVNVTSHPRPHRHHPRRPPCRRHPRCRPRRHLFAVPVLSAIERQEQRECTGQTSLLEKRLVIIQQLIVIYEGRPCSFDKAAV